MVCRCPLGASLGIPSEPRSSKVTSLRVHSLRMTTVIPRLARSLRARILGTRSFDVVQNDSQCAIWLVTQNFLGIFWNNEMHVCQFFMLGLKLTTSNYP